MADQNGGRTGEGGVFARIAGSAEYSIAAALLAVCVVVGGALWLLQPESADVVAAPVAAPTSAVAAVDEDAALSDWKRRLGEQFSEAEAEQRQRAADEERARRARVVAEQEAAAARRQAEADREAQRRLDATALTALTALATPRPTVGAPVAAPRTPAPVVRPTPPPVAAVQPTRVAAAIDWSSCEAPRYPALSVSRGEEGVVVIAADLDVAARIVDLRIAESSGHSRLDRVTLEAVRDCRFTPATQNGVPQAATAEVRFTWKLQN